MLWLDGLGLAEGAVRIVRGTLQTLLPVGVQPRSLLLQVLRRR